MWPLWLGCSPPLLATGCPPELLFRPNQFGQTLEDRAGGSENATSALQLLRRLL